MTVDLTTQGGPTNHSGSPPRQTVWPTAQKTRLENGLQLVTVPLPHLYAVTVMLFVRVGSRYETFEDSGISHLLEHVLFRGCEGFPTTYDFNAAAEAVSTGIDAATSRDFTTFEIGCAPDKLDDVLGLLSAMVSAPRLADVELEKKIIAEELQDELDEGGRDIDADNVAKMRLFPDSSLGLKVGGRLERIASLTLQDCQRWFKRHYGAKNLVLVVAGPMTHPAVADLVSERFGILPPGEAQRPTIARERSDLPALDYVKDTGRQSEVVLTWVLPAEEHPDWADLLVAQRVLDDGSCAKLRHRIVDQLGLAYHAGADLELYDGLSIFSVNTQTRHGQVVEVVDEVLAVLADLTANGPEPEPLKRARSRLLFDLETLRDSTPSIAYWFGLQHSFQGADTLERRVERVMGVTSTSLQTAAARHLRPSRMQLTIVGNISALDRAALRRRIHRIRSADKGLRHV
ncbi:MAG: putative Zn-dependent peptidase [Myxococcota bacterium]|jgi:predicted Zn-dependent peptidase